MTIIECENLNELLLGPGNYSGIETEQQSAKGADDGAPKNIGVYAANGHLHSKEKR